MFWPDLAPAHYVNYMLVRLEEQKIQHVSKEKSPPNVPQLRPIDSLFWSSVLSQSTFILRLK
jgi:hypothetical protein